MVKWAVASALTSFFAFTLLDPYYLQFFTTDRGLNLSPTLFGLYVSFHSLIGFLLEYPSGTFSDKFGRRLSWALGLFAYGVGLLWLSQVTSFYLTLITAAFQGMYFALKSGSSSGWLYDHVGKEGMREAYGTYYLLAVPLTIVGGIIATLLGLWVAIWVPIALVGIILIANGAFILTFTENYGSKDKTFLQIAKEGGSQFFKSPILQIIAVQSFFMTLPVWINSAWWLTYLVKHYNPTVGKTALMFTISAVGGAAVGVYLHRSEQTSYQRFILYPSLIMGVFYFMLPFFPTFWMYVGSITLVIVGARLRTAGLSILQNECIETERATALSFLGMISKFYWMVVPPLWGMVIELLTLKYTFLLAGGCTFLSLFLLSIALQMREDNENKN